jgi:beta-lactamase class A
LARVDSFFSRREITYSASCQVTAGTSGDDEIWAAGARPNARMFVGSAVKSFILAEYLQQFGVPRHQLSAIDDNIRSISGGVFGFEGSDPEVNLDGKTLTRNVLEAMISHSDNTATDSILADVGVDKVRELIADVGLSSVKIPDSTRRLFAYLASGRNVDVDWETLKGYVDNPPNPQNAINNKQSMLASAADMVRRMWQHGWRNPRWLAPRRSRPRSGHDYSSERNGGRGHPHRDQLHRRRSAA